MTASRRLILMAGVLGFLGVALGAFGSHGLADTLDANGRADSFDTASHYHLIHAVALLAVGVYAAQSGDRRALQAGYAMIAGTLIFSGSLYILSIFDVGMMGAIAPIGGSFLLIGWGLLAYSAWRGV